LKVFGHTFNEFEDIMGWRYDFVIVVNSLATRREVLQWYLDINAGGVVHTEAELQHVRNLLKREGKP
jgi:hypothetical protein